VIREILYYVGFLLILLLFTDEFARLVQWLRWYSRQHPRRRFILYPLIIVLGVLAGAIIASSLIRLATGFTFTYE
jgi:hypothetical protein